MNDGTWTLADCPPEAQAELTRALGVSAVTAAVLARRGHLDPDDARRFLEGEQPPHDPFLLGDMEAACERLRAAIAAGKRICVHGDYDVDGISATAFSITGSTLQSFASGAAVSRARFSGLEMIGSGPSPLSFSATASACE